VSTVAVQVLLLLFCPRMWAGRPASAVRLRVGVVQVCPLRMPVLDRLMQLRLLQLQPLLLWWW